METGFSYKFLLISGFCFQFKTPPIPHLLAVILRQPEIRKTLIVIETGWEKSGFSYFPMQNLLKIFPKISSVEIWPVISPK